MFQVLLFVLPWIARRLTRPRGRATLRRRRGWSVNCYPHSRTRWEINFNAIGLDSKVMCLFSPQSIIVLADWLKVRGSLKRWTKLWCVLKPGLLLIYRSQKTKVGLIYMKGIKLKFHC